MNTIQLDALSRHGKTRDDLFNLEELIESLSEFAGFNVHKVLDGETETGLYIMELVE